MKNTLPKVILFLGILTYGAFFHAPKTQAQVAASSSPVTVTCGSGQPTDHCRINIGTGLDGTFSSLYLGIQIDNQGGGRTVSVNIYEYADSSYTSGTLVTSYPDTTITKQCPTACTDDGGNTDQGISTIFTGAAPYRTDPTKYYQIELHQVGSFGVSYLYGIGSNTWYQIYDFNRITNNSQILFPYIPDNGSVSTSTTVGFAYAFNRAAGDDYDTAAIELQDGTTGTGVIQIQSPHQISADGNGSYVQWLPLLYGHLYIWRPVIYAQGTSTERISGSFYSFSAAIEATSTDLASGGNSAYLTATLGTSTLPQSTNLLSFLNVPNLLSTKVPFAYFFQVASGIQAGLSANTSTAIPSGSFVWKGINGTTTIDMFSTSTIGYYLSPTLIGAWRSFLLVIMLVEFGYAAYHKLKDKNII